MRLWGIFRFELAYQLRRPWPWLFFAVLLVIASLMARDHAIADALYEDFYANSPFPIATTTVFATLIWLLVAPAIAGEAGARDVGTRMHPLVYTVPVSKAEYLGGRFLAALLLNALILLGVQAGILLSVYMPGVNPETIGPFRPAAYLTAYGYLSLPNAFIATAIQFALAVRSGRAMASYVGSVLLVFMGFFVATLVRFVVMERLGMLLDPIGINFIVEDLAHQWTTIEKGSRLLALEGTVLRNRLLWVGVALGVLAFTYVTFRFAHRTESSLLDRLRSLGRGSWRRRPLEVQIPRLAALARDDTWKVIPSAVEGSAPAVIPSVVEGSAPAAEVRRTLAIAWASFRSIAWSLPGLALLVGLPMMTVLVVIDQMGAVGAPMIPTTARVLRELTGPLTAELSRWVIIPLVLVFFAGELVWRERDAGMGEITDAMPGSEWPPLLGKFLGLGLVLAAFTACIMAAGMLAQVVMGHHQFEIGLYIKVLFGLQLPEYLLFAMLALAVHTVVNQKYAGHLVGIMAYAFIAVLAGMLGIEHNLLVYGTGPGWSYTEMRGFASSLAPWAWFKLYWAAWALVLAVVARLLWVRGRESGPAVRLALARRRLTRATALTAAAAAGLVLALGGFVFYNTNVLNEYLSTADVGERRAEYERRYRRYSELAQPQPTAASLRVEVYPARRAAEIHGSYRLVNAGTHPIDSIHVATPASGVETGAVSFDRTATLALDDAAHGYRIYALGKPLEPGDTLRLDFDVRVQPRGFGNRGVSPELAARGSYFTNVAWFPAVGYQRRRELITPADRREHGLEPRPVIASLHENEGREPPTRGGGIAFDAVMGTDGDQVAVAPGALRRTWTEGGRRYFHYSTAAPIGGEWAFFSADYAVHEGQWKPDARADSAGSAGKAVAIRIFHHPEHTAHLDRTMRTVRASLDYLGRHFGTYPLSHLSIVENPGAPGTGLHADAGMISHGQSFPQWIPRDEPGSLDFPSAVMAHEMAHQWTVPYAVVEGAPFLSEGLAWYSALQVVKASRGSEQLRQVLSFMRQPTVFRPIRRGEPLLRGLDPYMSYRRGPFAMYALSEYVGEREINGAVRRLIELSDSPGARAVTTLDLYRELKAVTPDSLEPLLYDLFEVNTYWQLETKQASAQQTGAGAWQVTLDVRTRKMVYDSAGVVSEVPMDQWVEIGVFAESERGGELSAPLYLRKHRIRSGDQTITVTVPRKPVLAGIDPHHLLDWEEGDDDDNIERVEIDAARP